jgi:anti-repressor protein
MADQLAPLQQFEYLPGMNLRVLQKDGEPWFVAKDVCEALEMPTVNGTGQWFRDLDKTEKGSMRIVHGTSGGNPNTTIISESGLYLLVLKSRKPEAKAFQKWVTGEVPGGATDRQGRGIPLRKTTHGTSPESPT